MRRRKKRSSGFSGCDGSKDVSGLRCFSAGCFLGTAGFRARRAGVLSFAWPKESSQRKGHPRVGAPRCGVPCATRRTRGLRNSGLRPSDSPRPFPAPACVAQRLSGGRKSVLRTTICGEPEKQSKTGWCYPRLGDAEQRRLAGGRRLASVRAEGEFSQPPGQTSSAGDRAKPGVDSAVAFSLATFFWRSKRKYARRQGGTLRLQPERTAKSWIPASAGMTS